jgi:cobalt transporter subunit CbtB
MTIESAPPALDSERAGPAPRAALWPALAAAGLGCILLYVVGFAGADVVHEAAHDARHSMNFPCH